MSRCHSALRPPHGSFLLPFLTFPLCKRLPAPPPKLQLIQDRKDRMEEQSRTASLLCTLRQNELIKQKTDSVFFCTLPTKRQGQHGTTAHAIIRREEKRKHIPTGYPELLRILGPVKHTPVSDKISGIWKHA